MNNIKLILFGVVILVVLIAGVLLFSNKSTTTNNNQNATPTQAASQQGAIESTEVNVNIMQNGYEPSTVTIKAGTKVVWTNKSGATANVSSDIHPTHLLWPFLNLGSFADGEMVSVVFDESGTYTYHDHLNPSRKGTVVVQ